MSLSHVWLSLSRVWFSLSNVWFSSSPTKYSHSKLSLSQKCCICHTATSSPQEIDSLTQLTQPEVEVLVDVTRTAPYNPHSPQVFISQYSKSETLLNGLFSFEYHTLNWTCITRVFLRATTTHHLCGMRWAHTSNIILVKNSYLFIFCRGTSQIQVDKMSNLYIFALSLWMKRDTFHPTLYLLYTGESSSTKFFLSPSALTTRKCKNLTH